jgi:hypothetical protein
MGIERMKLVGSDGKDSLSSTGISCEKYLLLLRLKLPAHAGTAVLDLEDGNKNCKYKQ